MDAEGVGDTIWAIISDEAREPCINMAIDDMLLDEVASGCRAPTLRFYGWSSPAVSVGRFQDVERTVDLQACRTHGVMVVRRPTGGRGVLHGSDITVSVTAPDLMLGRAGRSVTESHRLITSGLTAGLTRLGVDAQTSGAHRALDPISGDCFSAQSEADVADRDGHKIIGGAQCRRRGAFMEQLSVLHQRHLLKPSAIFRGATPTYAFPLEAFDQSVVRDALLTGLLAALGVGPHLYIEVDPLLLGRASRRAHAYAVDTHPAMC